MGIMIRDKEIERLQTEMENMKRLYDYSLKECEKLREEVKKLRAGKDSYVEQLKAENGILERTIDIYVRKLAESRRWVF